MWLWPFSDGLITLAVVTMDENARVTSAIGDMTEPELTVSADGSRSSNRWPGARPAGSVAVVAG